jgi:hypothetical protein
MRFGAVASPESVGSSSSEWQPLDLDSLIQEKLASIEEQAKAVAIDDLELRRKLRQVGR